MQELQQASWLIYLIQGKLHGLGLIVLGIWVRDGFSHIFEVICNLMWIRPFHVYIEFSLCGQHLLADLHGEIYIHG